MNVSIIGPPPLSLGSLWDEAEEMVEKYLREGKLAMKIRARTVHKRWARGERSRK
jgi:hypothetical protein